MLSLQCFKAGKGDCFLITWYTDQEYRLLIDSGIEGTYRFFNKIVKDFNENDFVIVTHIDYDHIGGLFKWLLDKSNPFNTKTTIYINTPELILTPNNSGKVAVKHGVKLNALLKEKSIITRPLYSREDCDNKLFIGNIELEILSPTEEVVLELINKWTADDIYQKYIESKQKIDNKVSSQNKVDFKSIEDILNIPPKPHVWKDDLLNSSSIAFILKYGNINLLFMGDANPDLIADELSRRGWSEENKLQLNMLKISHHGSKFNTTKRLLKMINCSQYLISTDSSGPYYHPSRETIILISEYGRSNKKESITIYTNYKLNISDYLTNEEMINIEFRLIENIEFIKKEENEESK